jgi:hypothetical protein
MYRTISSAVCLLLANVVSARLACSEDEFALTSSLRQDLDAILELTPTRENAQVAEEQLAQELRSLETKYDAIYLLRQLIIYQETTADEQRAIGAHWLSRRLAQKIKAIDIVQAMDPLLSHHNAHVRRQAAEVVGSLFLGQPTVDFAAMAMLLGGSDDTIAQYRNVILWMFANDPTGALLAFARTQKLTTDQWRNVLLAEHEISDVVWRQTQNFEIDKLAFAAAQVKLDKLSKSKHWWSRLYVAEIIRQHPLFRTDVLAAQLTNDENALVREIASAKLNAK